MCVCVSGAIMSEDILMNDGCNDLVMTGGIEDENILVRYVCVTVCEWCL